MESLLENKGLITIRLIEDCTLEQQKEIRNIRNQISVRASMYSDHLISSEEHINWIKSVTTNEKNIVFVVLGYAEKVLGVVSLQNYEVKQKRSSWAFYLDEDVRGGLGAFIEFNFLDFSFIELGLEKLNCEVIESNEPVIKLHKKFYFLEEGLRRSEVIKNHNRVGVILLGLLKEEWLSNREAFLGKYSSIFSKYSIVIEADRLVKNDR
jgi:UDP-4-amino-4,6-dideoxy-N-acetyl-beta-L-altrosamine N-acetyltransferase